MKTEQWQRGQDIFAAAVALPADERTPFVDAQCEGDPELRERVQRWLRADEAAGIFLDEPLAPPPLIPVLDDASPTHLGAYRLLELIGEGGMGTVFRARRDDDVFDRDVAVKILSRFSMTQESERRFRFERRVLAALDHPWIARVYDGGTTPEGLPYLVIELVDGQPIDDYCDRRDLSIRERILLFRKVCAAVQASHRALVVHCDLKPSNILVTVDGEPKLLDFGVAKLLGGEVIAVRDEEITQWPRPLTPQYASPEQLRGGVISTTSDVYSLGVLLYKILTGQRPHDLEGLTLVEAIERVTTEPTPPSRVPAQAGGDTPPSAEATPSGLAGDLDAIVLKALRGDPDERYPSVEQLDADLGRHLEGFPILARRGTVRYRATRFLRRHRVAVSLGTAAFVVLVAFGAYMAVMAERVSQEKGRLQEVMTFTLQIFRTAGPIGEYPQLSLREAVDRNAGLIDESFRDQPEIRAGVLEVLGDIYLDFGESERALELLEEARDLHATTYGPESVEYHRSLDRVGAALREMSRLDDSEASIQEALSWFREHTPNDAVRIVRSLNNLVDTYCYREDYGLAEAPSEEALRLAKRHLGGRSLDSAAATIQRAVVLRNTGRPAEASELYREGLKQYELAQGADHPYQATLLNNLSLIYRDQGQLDLAEGSLQKAEELYRASLGDRSVSRVRPALALATIAVHRGDRESAIERFRRAVQVAIDVDGHPFYPLRAGSDFARYLLETDRCEDGVDLMRASLERTRAETVDYSPYFQLEGLLGACLLRLGDSEEARMLIERSHRELVRLAPDNQDAIREAEEWIALLEGTPVTTGRQ